MHNTHRDHSLYRQFAPTNGLYCLCYESFWLMKLGIERHTQNKLLFHFLDYNGDYQSTGCAF